MTVYTVSLPTSQYAVTNRRVLCNSLVHYFQLLANYFCIMISTFYHRQRGSDCTVLTATGLVNGEWQILTPYRIKTLEPIDKKFGTRDYVGETTPMPNLVQIGARGASGQICEI